jgi:hypothetical protein
VTVTPILWSKYTVSATVTRRSGFTSKEVSNNKGESKKGGVAAYTANCGLLLALPIASCYSAGRTAGSRALLGRHLAGRPRPVKNPELPKHHGHVYNLFFSFKDSILIIISLYFIVLGSWGWGGKQLHKTQDCSSRWQ